VNQARYGIPGLELEQFKLHNDLVNFISP
jgi:hypothetical protein